LTVSFHFKIFSDYLNLYIIINYFLYVYYLLPFRVSYIMLAIKDTALSKKD